MGELVGFHAGVGQGGLGGTQSQIGRGFARSGHPAFFDAGAGGDPLVSGFDDLFQIGVGHDRFRHVKAQAANVGVMCHGVKNRLSVGR